MTDEQLEAIAKKRVEARMGFIMHVMMYLVGNLGLVVIWALTGSGYPWFVWPMSGWGIGVASHGLALLSGPESVRRQRALECERQRLHAQH